MIGVMKRNTHVVGRGGDGDRSGAPHVGVAQLVGQLLQLVRLEPVVIPENVVVSWSGGSLDPLVGAEVEVELCRVGDADVHGSAGGDVPALAALLLLVGAEQPGVVALLHHNERDAGLVVSLELNKDKIRSDGSIH